MSTGRTLRPCSPLTGEAEGRAAWGLVYGLGARGLGTLKAGRSRCGQTQVQWGFGGAGLLCRASGGSSPLAGTQQAAPAAPSCACYRETRA